MPGRARGRGRGRGVVPPRTMGTRQRAAPDNDSEAARENEIDIVLEQPQIERPNARLTVAQLAKTVNVLQKNSASCMNRVMNLETQMENSNVLVKGLD